MDNHVIEVEPIYHSGIEGDVDNGKVDAVNIRILCDGEEIQHILVGKLNWAKFHEMLNRADIYFIL